MSPCYIWFLRSSDTHGLPSIAKFCKLLRVLQNTPTDLIYDESTTLESEYECKAKSSDTCTMTCEHAAEDVTISCGDAGTTCIYNCNNPKCNGNGIIDARNANNFHVHIQEKVDECISKATT